MLVHNRFFWIPVCWLALRSTRPYGLLRLMVITIFRFINKKENTRWILIAVDEHYNSTLGRFRRWRWNRPSDTHVCTNVYCIFAISRRTPETNYNDEWTLQLIMHVYIHDRRYLLIKTTNGSTVVRRIRPEKWRRVASGRDGVLRRGLAAIRARLNLLRAGLRRYEDGWKMQIETRLDDSYFYCTVRMQNILQFNKIGATEPGPVRTAL